MTDSEIVKALEYEANEKVCIHEVYEPACGMWCKHLHLWCTDFNGNSNKNNCSAFKPTATNKRTKAILNLINRLQAENENLKDILYDAEGVNLVNYWHQQFKIAENGCRNFEKELKTAKAEAYKECIEKVKDTDQCTFDGWIEFPEDRLDNLLKELVGENDAR